ncbi:hypothetical protein GCM10023116_25440 [Kistimonas scapharcae]|uniref:Uncharacterized protein n=1 Tax=Kistimonas scapharcae TaxID=1036133 RepID=A0ABP8V2U3_9GAMM
MKNVVLLMSCLFSSHLLATGTPLCDTAEVRNQLIAIEKSRQPGIDFTLPPGKVEFIRSVQHGGKMLHICRATVLRRDDRQNSVESAVVYYTEPVKETESGFSIVILNRKNDQRDI